MKANGAHSNAPNIEMNLSSFSANATDNVTENMTTNVLEKFLRVVLNTDLFFRLLKNHPSRILLAG